MRIGMVCLGLAICSLAGTGGFAQEAAVSSGSADVSATAEAETDVTVEENGAKSKRKVRIQRTLPGGEVEVEEFGDDVVRLKKPMRRGRVEVIEDDGEENDDVYRERRVEVRPQIRVFPKERELVVRRGQGEMRIDLDLDEPTGPSIRKQIRPGLRFGGPDELANADGPIAHLEEAIRHLKKAKMSDMAARLEAELRELRARRSEIESGRGEELRSLREERDALREELRKLREEIGKQNRSEGTKKSQSEGEER